MHLILWPPLNNHIPVLSVSGEVLAFFFYLHSYYLTNSCFFFLFFFVILRLSSTVFSFGWGGCYRFQNPSALFLLVFFVFLILLDIFSLFFLCQRINDFPNSLISRKKNIKKNKKILRCNLTVFILSENIFVLFLLIY